MTTNENLAKQVLANCNISDARHAGLYSVCGLALRLRDLFKWDQSLPPWQEREAAEVLTWIGEKETHWETLEDREFEDLTIDGRQYDPFDTQNINNVLASRNLFYGAGYAHSLKPTFFLAPIISKKEIEGIPVYCLGRELARDLLTLPAMTQSGEIVLRTEAAKLYLWDQIAYIKKSARPALETALAACNIGGSDSNAIKANFDTIFHIVKNTYIRHELGEIKDRTFDLEIWRKIVSQFRHTPVELLARAVKDVLADTHPSGAISRVVENRETAALGFYAAFFDGLGKEIFPHIRKGFIAFTQTSDWRVMLDGVDRCRESATAIAHQMTEIFLEGENCKDRRWTAATVDRRLIAPRLKQPNTL